MRQHRSDHTDVNNPQSLWRLPRRDVSGPRSDDTGRDWRAQQIRVGSNDRRPAKAERASTPSPPVEKPLNERLKDTFTEASVNEAWAILFGRNASSEKEAVESPLQNQFLPSAHRHLMFYFAHCALGDSAEQAEPEIQAFFSDIKKQRREKAQIGNDIPLLDEEVLTRENLDGLVQEAIKKLEPKGP